MDRSPRLAELVVHLTGCTPEAAIAAVNAVTSPDTTDTSPDTTDALAIVARAMCSIRHLDLTEPVDLRETNEVNTKS